jgi:hypothetical protein
MASCILYAGKRLCRRTANLGALISLSSIGSLLWIGMALAVERVNVAAAHAPAQTMALADRMIISGSLLILFALLATISLAMWRDLGRRARRI